MKGFGGFRTMDGRYFGRFLESFFFFFVSSDFLFGFQHHFISHMIRWNYIFFVLLYAHDTQPRGIRQPGLMN